MSHRSSQVNKQVIIITSKQNKCKTHSSEFVCVVSCQTAEEIDQLTVDEDLNDIERAVYLLR